jgi:hypothetical protein
MSDDIVAKIVALLRKTEDAGCTPEESHAAQVAAARLMAKHNIDQAVVENAEAKAEAKRLNLVDILVNTGRDKCYTDEHIQRILRQCFCVKVYWSRVYDFEDHKARVEKYREKKDLWNKWFYEDKQKGPKPCNYPSFPNLKERYAYTLVGDKPDCDLAAALIPEFRRTMRHGLARHLRETGETWTVELADSYHAGFAAGYIDANEEAEKEVLLEAGKTMAAQYALVVVDKKKAVEEYAKENITTVRSRRGSGNGARSGGYNADAAQAGRETGSKLNLKRGRLS